MRYIHLGQCFTWRQHAEVIKIILLKTRNVSMALLVPRSPLGLHSQILIYTGTSLDVRNPRLADGGHIREIPALQNRQLRWLADAYGFVSNRQIHEYFCVPSLRDVLLRTAKDPPGPALRIRQIDNIYVNSRRESIRIRTLPWHVN